MTVVAQVPDGMLPVPLGTSGPTTPVLEGQSVRFGPLAELPPGQALTYRVLVRADRVGQYRFRAEVSSGALPVPRPGETTTEVIAAVPAFPDATPAVRPTPHQISLRVGTLSGGRRQRPSPDKRFSTCPTDAAPNRPPWTPAGA